MAGFGIGLARGGASAARGASAAARGASAAARGASTAARGGSAAARGAASVVTREVNAGRAVATPTVEYTPAPKNRGLVNRGRGMSTRQTRRTPLTQSPAIQDSLLKQAQASPEWQYLDDATKRKLHEMDLIGAEGTFAEEQMYQARYQEWEGAIEREGVTMTPYEGAGDGGVDMKITTSNSAGPTSSSGLGGGSSGRNGPHAAQYQHPNEGLEAGRGLQEGKDFIPMNSRQNVHVADTPPPRGKTPSHRDLIPETPEYQHVPETPQYQQYKPTYSEYKPNVDRGAEIARQEARRTAHKASIEQNIEQMSGKPAEGGPLRKRHQAPEYDFKQQMAHDRSLHGSYPPGPRGLANAVHDHAYNHSPGYRQMVRRFSDMRGGMRQVVARHRGGIRAMMSRAARISGGVGGIATLVSIVWNYLDSESSKSRDIPSDLPPSRPGRGDGFQPHSPSETTFPSSSRKRENPSGPFDAYNYASGLPGRSETEERTAGKESPGSNDLGFSQLTNPPAIASKPRQLQFGASATGALQGLAGNMQNVDWEDMLKTVTTTEGVENLLGTALQAVGAADAVGSVSQAMNNPFTGIANKFESDPNGVAHKVAGLIDFAGAVSSFNPWAIVESFKENFLPDEEEPAPAPVEEPAEPVPEIENEGGEDWTAFDNIAKKEVEVTTGGSEPPKKRLALAGAAINVVAAFAPLGVSDSSIPKSSPTLPNNNLMDVEVQFKSEIPVNRPMEGDILTERSNDRRARKLQTSIETKGDVESADAFHPNQYYEPAVNPKLAYDREAAKAVVFRPPDDSTRGYSWEWQQPSLRRHNRDPEIFTGFTYDTSQNPTIPANVDVYTRSDDVPMPYTPTEPRMGPQLYDAPQLVGVGFDERNPVPDPMTTTHTTSSTMSTSGAQLVSSGKSAQPNPDTLAPQANNSTAQVAGNRAVNPPAKKAMGTVQRRPRDGYNAANQTNQFAWSSKPTAPNEAVPANIGKSM